jgi:hypothetical protein
MSRAKSVLLSLVVVLVVGVVMVSSASGAISFVWKVGGAELKAGESKGYTINNDGKIFDLTWSIAGVAVLMLSNKIKVEPGAKIIGGKPGTNEETVVFENVTVDNPAGCTVESLPEPVVGIVRTRPLLTLIVEGQSGGRGNGEPLILFEPKEGTTFTTMRFLNATGKTCPVNLAEGSIEGNILGLPLPQKTEVVQGNLVFESVTKEYLVASGGVVRTAGLKFAGNTVTLTGLTLVLLESGQAFGAF